MVLHSEEFTSQVTLDYALARSKKRVRNLEERQVIIGCYEDISSRYHPDF